jgi:hypothetical protein
MGSPTLRKLKEPIMLPPWLCFQTSPNQPRWQAQRHGVLGTSLGDSRVYTPPAQFAPAYPSQCYPRNCISFLSDTEDLRCIGAAFEGFP